MSLSSKLFIKPITFPNTNDATSASDTNASVHIAGGISIQKALYVGLTAYFASGFDAGSSRLTNVLTPVNSTDGANKAYVDSHLQNIDFTLYYNPSNYLGISSAGISTGLLGGSGTAVSVNPTQSLSNLTVTTSASFSGITVNNVGNPIVSTDCVNKYYSDSQVAIAGTGLSSSGFTLSVNTTQSQIISVGTLNGLTVSGTSLVTNTNDSTLTTNGAFQVYGGVGIRKSMNVGGSIYSNNNVNASTSFISSSTSLQYSTTNVTGTFDFYAQGLSSPTFQFLNSTSSASSSTILTGTASCGNVILSNSSNQIYYNASGSNDISDFANSAPTFNFKNSLGSTLNSTVNVGILKVNNTTNAISFSTGCAVFSGGVGITNDLYIGGALYLSGGIGLSSLSLTSTVDSVSTTTGTLVVPGGCGIAKSVYIGLTLNVTGAATFNSTISDTNTTESTSPTVGSVTLSGGLGINKSLWVNSGFNVNGITSSFNTTESTSVGSGSVILLGGFSTAKNTFIGGTINVSGIANFTNTTNSVSTSTGSIICLGGLGIASNVYFGAALNVTNQTSSATLNITSTTDSSSVSTGCAIFSGGIGISKSLYIGTALNVSGTSSFTTISVSTTTDSVSTSTGCVTLLGGLGIAKSLYIGSVLNVTGQSTLVNLSTTSTTDSSNISNGSIVVAGGIGITKSMNIGGSITITNNLTIMGTTDSSSSVTGAGIISGGLGIAKSLNIGLGLSVSGTSNLTGQVSILNTIDSSSSTTGSTVISGGLGVAKKLFVGSNITTTGTISAQSASFTTALPILSGGTGFTSVVTSPTASTIASWDSNVNFAANNFKNGFSTTATSGSTTTLTIASTGLQFFTGTLTQTVVLPVVSTLSTGFQFAIINNSTGNLTINSSGGNLVQTMTTGTQLILTCILITGTGTSSWYGSYTGQLIITTTPTANTQASWDTNSNLSANNFKYGYNTTATAAGTTTLTVASTGLQFFTGSTTQTVTLPVVSTLTTGFQFTIINNSTGNVTVQSSGANSIQIMTTGTQIVLTCISTSGTTAASWNANYSGNSNNISASTSISLAASTSSITAATSINAQGYMINSTTLGNSITTDMKVMNKRIRVPRGNVISAISTWTNISSPSSQWLAVCYSSELNLFVSVGAAGAIMYSQNNGYSWVNLTPVGDSNWNSVIWVAALGIFVAVGFGGTGTANVISSTNGISWTNQTAANSNAYKAVVYSQELQLLVAVSSSGTTTDIMTCADSAVTWIARTTPNTNGYYSIAYSPQLLQFVCLADSGTNRVIYSSDAVNWSQTTSVNNLLFTSIVWADELYLYVAIAQSGVGNRIMVSKNGTTWSSVTSPADNQWYSLTWSSHLSVLVAVAQSGTANIMYSFSGYQWFTVNTTQNLFNSICYAPELGIFVSVDYSQTGSDVIVSNPAISTPYNTFSSNSTSVFTVNNTTDTTAVGNGSLIVNGGASIAKNLAIGSNIISMGSASNAKMKFYSYTGSITNTNPGIIVLNLTSTTATYYAKVTAILYEQSATTNISTLSFEMCGRNTSGVAIWNLLENHPTNSFPWSSTVTGTGGSTTPSVTFRPVTGSRSYGYDIFLQFFGSTATLSSISQDSVTVQSFSY